MGWGRIDDGFHAHGKRELVDVACDGLWVRALSRAVDLGTDGFVEESWVAKQLKPTVRRRVIDASIRHGLLDPLAAGESRAIIAAATPGLRPDAREVTVGPFEQPGYLVHDFLDFNHSREEAEERRQQDRRKKQRQRAKGRQDVLPWDAAGRGVPQGQEDVSPGVSPVMSLNGTGSGEVHPVDARAPSRPAPGGGQQAGMDQARRFMEMARGAQDGDGS